MLLKGLFETGMLVCFGAAWPVSILKSVRSRDVRGKSPLFLFIILLGYILGVLHKIFFNYDWVVYLYCLNGIMVTIDILLYFRFRRQ